MKKNQSTLLTFELSGLSCMKCVKKVNDALSAIPDITDAEITKESARVRFDNTQNDKNQLATSFIELVRSLGYQAVLNNIEHNIEHNNDSSENPSCNSTENDNQSKPVCCKNASASAPQNETNQLNSSNNHANETSLPLTIIKLKIEGMSCASCVKHVEDTLLNVPNVLSANVNLARGIAIVRGSALNIEHLIQASTQAGYPAIEQSNKTHDRELNRNNQKRALRILSMKTAIALTLGMLLMIWGFIGNMHVTATNQIGWLVVGIITLFVIVGTGGHFFKNAWLQLKQRRSNMDTLVSLGVGAAWSYSFIINLVPNIVPAEHRYLYYEASVMIIGLINLGKYLEHRAKLVSSTALEQLLDLTPQHVMLVTPASSEFTTELADKSVSVDALLEGDLIRLRMGERIAVDGEIVSGELAINESMLTGESKLVHKQLGDTVFAGTLVENGTAVIRAKAIGEATQLAHIIEKVEQAQSSKPKLAKLADRISAIFVPVILLIATLTAIIWLLFGPSPTISFALVTTVSVLIIACPCALGLAIPMSIITSVGRAAKLGILVRDASVLERATQIDILVFDKTGTITEGKPKLTQTFLFNDQQGPDQQFSEQSAILLAAQLELGSTHPLAEAFNAAQKRVKLDLNSQLISTESVNNFNTWIGEGVSGEIKQQTIVLGNQALLKRFDIDDTILNSDTSITSKQINERLKNGSTVVYLAVNQILKAAFVIEDTLRTEAAMIMTQLQSSSEKTYEVILLTGDNPQTAKTIAEQANIKRVIAGVKPLDKAQHIKELQAKGKRVAMIGDGINDAPALAQADLSIAMGAGSDIAKESADFILLNNKLTQLPLVFDLANRVQKNMKQNLFFAFIYNIAAIPIAAGVLYPLTGILLNPMIAAAAMALSSVTVVTNANRLLR